MLSHRCLQHLQLSLLQAKKFSARYIDECEFPINISLLILCALCDTGPPKVPWFGSYIFMLLIDYKHLHKAAQKICEFYKSNIIGMHLGSTPVIILNDNEKVKKALLHRDFDGKPDVLIGRLRDPDFNLRGK